MTPNKKKSSGKGRFVWPGLLPIAKSIVYGAVDKSPKLRSFGRVTPVPEADSNYNYDAMKPDAYRWFRQDEIVRRCVVINAAYAVMAAGFETELEPVEEIKGDTPEATEKAEKEFQEKYKYIKDYVDAANRAVNLDQALFVAQVKRSIFGKAGFEIEYDATGAPSWLLSVNSRNITPYIDEDWTLLGYKYLGKTMWSVDDDRFLYFANLSLESDREGLSDVEPVNLVCKARHNLLRRDLTEITRSLWAPYVVLSADTSGMASSDEDAFLDSLIEAAKSGKSIAINKQVSATVVDHKLNLTGLVALLEKLEESIIRNFGTPRFLVNKPTENRATAYTEFEAYEGSTLANIQRFFKRELEAQWYPILVKLALKKNGESGTVPLKVRHVWNKIRVADVYNMANAVAALYNNGMGILADDPEIAYDMMSWPKEKLLERLEQEKKLLQQQTAPVPEGKPETPAPGLPGEETVDDGAAEQS